MQSAKILNLWITNTKNQFPLSSIDKNIKSKGCDHYIWTFMCPIRYDSGSIRF